VADIAKWKKHGWRKNPLYRSYEKFKIEALYSDGIVEQLEVLPGNIIDIGSVPDIVPDLIADDHGWLGQTIFYIWHDVDYATKWCSRSEADFRLYEGLSFVGVHPASCKLIYASVRVGGYFCWEKPDEIIQKFRTLANRQPIPGFTLNSNQEDVVIWQKAA